MDEPQLAVREGRLLAPRLARAEAVAAGGAGGGWRLAVGGGGLLGGLGVGASSGGGGVGVGGGRVGGRGGGLGFAGVGMAAVRWARVRGGEVYATASRSKWDAVCGLGVEECRIASSRDLGFRERFLEATGGAGVDVVLDALSGEFVDASLELLPRGGRFIEMGKADIRDPGVVAREHAGVRYRSYDLLEAGPERIQGRLGEGLGRFERGVLEPGPIRAGGLRRGGAGVRHHRE